MTIEDCYKIGYIMKPHGLRGEVTIALDPEAPEDLTSLKTVFIEVRERLLPCFVERISQGGNKAFLKLQDVDTPEAAADISKSAIYLPKASRPKSAPDTFYDDEIMGYEVRDTEAGALGKIREIVNAGPNRLLAIDRDGKEVLIPLNSPFINSINKRQKRITVTLPGGFLEI